MPSPATAAFPGRAAAAGFADHRYFRDHVISSVQTYTVIGDDILSVHCAYGHFYVLNGEIATYPSSGTVLGDRRRETVMEKRKQDTESWRRRNPCAVSAGSVALR